MKQIKIFKNFMNGFIYLPRSCGVFLTLNNIFDYQIFFVQPIFLIYPVLAAFIAFAISDRPGLILGLLAGGLVALSGGGPP